MHRIFSLKAANLWKIRKEITLSSYFTLIWLKSPRARRRRSFNRSIGEASSKQTDRRANQDREFVHRDYKRRFATRKSGPQIINMKHRNLFQPGSNQVVFLTHFLLAFKNGAETATWLIASIWTSKELKTKLMTIYRVKQHNLTERRRHQSFSRKSAEILSEKSWKNLVFRRPSLLL